MTFDMTLVNPCPEVELSAASESPFVDFKQEFLGPATEIEYNGQSLAETGLTTDCGPYIFFFFDSESKELLESNVFDEGLSQQVPITTEGEELRTFKMLKASSKSQIDKTYSITYTVYLRDYPEIRVEKSFTATYVVSNFCDTGLAAFDFKISEQCERTRAAIEPKWLRDLENPLVY